MTKKLGDIQFSWLGFIKACFAFCVGVVFGITAGGTFDIFGNRGTFLKINDTKPGAIYNKIEIPKLCMLLEEGVFSQKKVYALSDCPARFTITENAKGKYKIERLPALSSIPEKK